MEIETMAEPPSPPPHLMHQSMLHLLRNIKHVRILPVILFLGRREGRMTHTSHEPLIDWDAEGPLAVSVKDVHRHKEAKSSEMGQFDEAQTIGLPNTFTQFRFAILDGLDSEEGWEHKVGFLKKLLQETPGPSKQILHGSAHDKKQGGLRRRGPRQQLLGLNSWPRPDHPPF